MTVQITRNIDWLSLTFPGGESPSQIWPHDEFVYIGKGLHGYRRTDQSSYYGVQAMWLGTEEMGTHMVFTGDCLSIIREQLGRGNLPVFAVYTTHGGRASRIDLAIDIVGGSITPDKAYKALKKGQLKTGARAWRFVQGNTEGRFGDTLYLGSRESEQFIRIYDKSAERNMTDGVARLRLEVELKGMKARAAMETAIKHGVDAVTVGIFEQAIQWDVPDYRLALDAPGVALPELPRTESNTEKWLLSQVIPALAKLVRVKPSFREKFDNALNSELRRLDAISQGGIDEMNNQE